MEVTQAISKFRITNKVRKLLIDNPAISALISNKVFPLFAPANIEGDFIVYFRDEYSKDYSKMGIYNENCKIFVCAISDDYDNSQILAELINDTLEGNHEQNLNTNYQIKLIDSTEDADGGKYLQILLFEIK